MAYAEFNDQTAPLFGGEINPPAFGFGKSQNTNTQPSIPRGNSWFGTNCKDYGPHPFLYGAICSSPGYTTNQMVISPSVFVIFVAFSVIMKRKSAQPGGNIYYYNQVKVHKFYLDRRRRLRDMLNDPVLTKDMEKMYGDLSSLRERVKQWESDGFAIQKKEDDGCVKGSGGRVHVPWIQSANIFLRLTFVFTMYFNFNRWTMMIWLTSLVHLVDNMLLHKAAIARVGGKEGTKSEDKGLIANVGVPVAEVDVGVPVDLAMVV